MSQDAKTQVNWQGLRLSTGFYLSHLIQGIEALAETPAQVEGIQRVQALFDTDCQDYNDWNAAANALGDLIQAHPDRLRESGTWHDGSASICALAAAMEAARCAAAHLSPIAEKWEPDAKAFKCFKYVLRAYGYAGGEMSANCLKFLERVVNLPPAQ